MLDKSAVIPLDHRRHRLRSRAEGPPDLGVHRGRRPAAGALHRDFRTRVLVANPARSPQFPPVEMLAGEYRQRPRVSRCPLIPRSFGVTGGAFSGSGRRCGQRARGRRQSGYCDSENKSRCLATSASEICFTRANARADSGFRPSACNTLP